LPLRVNAARSGVIEWFVDGVPAGSADSSASLAWPLAPGKHHITARDASGRTAQSSIEVR
jgi:membrane carboxypeptidase/penicillin-binding protein PbpC